MTCPRCHTAEMTEKDRRGVEIDVCKSCRGVWLDRGELDRLNADSVEALRQGDEDDLADDGDHARRRRARTGDRDDEPGRRWSDVLS